MSNVPEGFARKTDRDFARFLDMARGSCSEVQSLLYVALDVGHLSQQKFDQLYDNADATAAMISRLSTYFRSRTEPNSPGSRPDADSSI